MRRKLDLPVGKALLVAKERLPGWAWAVLNTESFVLPPGGLVKKRASSLVDVMKVFSFSKVQTIRGESCNMGVAPVYAEAIINKCNDKKLVMRALGEAFDVLPGWAFATLQSELVKERGDAVFLLCDDSLGHEADRVFKEVYIPLLGDPVYKVVHPNDVMGGAPGSAVIALGQMPDKINGLRVIESNATLPHPAALYKFGDKGEVARKARGIRSLLDDIARSVVKKETGLTKPDDTNPQSTGPSASLESDKNTVIVQISKADEEKQVVTGVVLAPYAIDQQGDSLAPATIEDAAFKWMGSSRVIGLNHTKEAAGAVPVESYLMPYPTKADYDKAMDGEQHRAYRVKMGEDLVTSGSWVLSTKLSSSLWAAFKNGDFQAYSIGGYGERKPHDNDSIPQVDYMEIDDGSEFKEG